MSVDFSGALRLRKPDKRLIQLTPRALDDLPSAEGAPSGIVPLVLDTNVYIRDAAGTLPLSVELLLDRARLFHCGVCLAELATGVANANPRHASWSALRDHYRTFMAEIPATRVLVPNDQTWLDAGLLSGIVARTQGYQSHQRKEALNDALIFLTATRAGLPVLTANRVDFDLLQQLAPEGRFYHY